MSLYQQGAATSAFTQQRPEGVTAEAVSYQGAGVVIGAGPVTNSAPGLIGTNEGVGVTPGEIHKGKILDTNNCSIIFTNLLFFL